jgi:hypothetical protein
MISLKIPQKLLDVACHDTQFSVQESALNTLKMFCKYEKARLCLKDLDAIEKLTNINFLLVSNSELNSSTKSNYLNAALACKSIIQAIKSS